jgi:hypothetical protein
MMARSVDPRPPSCGDPSPDTKERAVAKRSKREIRRDGAEAGAEPLTLDSEIGPLDVATVAEGYARYARALKSGAAKGLADDDPDVVADDVFRRVLHDGPAAAAWELVLEVLRRAPDEELGFFAAGPLEDVVRRFGVELVGRIEAEARRDARFRWALGRIWLSRGVLPDTVLDRVVAASGGEILVHGRLDELPPPDAPKKRRARR